MPSATDLPEFRSVMLREFLAPNASAMTLDGTRTYLVGSARVVVVDPGSSSPGHLAAIAEAVGDGACTAVVVTHRHPDHAAGAAELARRLGAPLRSMGRQTLGDGDVLDTDGGELVALATAGHTPDHLALHWPSAGAGFCGDLMMGGRDTALVALPEGNLADYLASLERIRALSPAVIHPAHGPSFQEPIPAIDAYVRHRQERLDQVRAAVAAGVHTPNGVVNHVYGSALDEGLRAAARGAVEAYLAHLQERGELAWPH